MIKKKRFLLMCVLALWVFAGAGATALAAQSPQIPIAVNTIPKYVNQLPLLTIANPTVTLPIPNNTMQTVFGNVLPDGTPAPGLTLRMCEFKANVLPAGAVAGYAGTWVFGYLVDPTGTNTCAQLIDLYESTPGSKILDTYIGPVIVNERNHLPGGAGSTNITFVNDLPTVSFTAANVLQTPNVLAFGYGTDKTMHWADPLHAEFNDCAEKVALGTFLAAPYQFYPPFGDDCAQNYAGPIPAVPHLHGGEVPPELDGGPDAWWTADGITGHAYYSFTPATGKAIYNYPNTQEASPIWFHDHVLGITRLNVFAGLAGAYLITDPALVLPNGLHSAGLEYDPYDGTSVEYTVPLVIQDRAFDTNGQLFYQSDSAGGVLWATNPEHPYWTPEFLGDVIVVNGKAWPNLFVEPKRYRFWLINGSNARTYELKLPDQNGVLMPIYVIATDGGYLNTAIPVTKLVIMPGERYEVIIDFGLVPVGTMLTMKNSAKSPYPAGAPVVGATTGSVMQFTVNAPPVGFADTSYDPLVTPTIRSVTAPNQRIVRLADPALGTLAAGVTADKTRLLTLNEVMGLPQIVTDPVTGVANTGYPGGPLEVLVNNTRYSGKYAYDDDNSALTPPIMNPRLDFTVITTIDDTTYYSELPEEGTTEVWEIVNITADAHPIHLHLVQFQIINRENFDVANYIATYNQAFPGGGFNPATKVRYNAGVFMPGYGPPYNPTPAVGCIKANDPAGCKYGGNPDIAKTFLKNKKQVPFLSGKPTPPLPQEAGWKDTVVAYPGQVTRLAVRWAPTDLAIDPLPPYPNLYYPFDPRGTVTGGQSYAHGYVWHCHIVDHEDNEMMRPFSVTLNPVVTAPRPLVKGVAY